MFLTFFTGGIGTSDIEGLALPSGVARIFWREVLIVIIKYYI
jgi:hypothetical protein